MRSPLLLALLLAALPLLRAQPVPAAPRSVEAVEECMRDNLPERTSHQAVRFRAVDRLGAATESQADIYWSRHGEGSRALLRFGAPPDIRGSALLMIEKPERNDMFMYLPELKKVRRVSGRGVASAMFGTDFSYEDFERLQGMADQAKSKQLPDAELEGRGVSMLETVPPRGEDSQYERILSYVDHRTCVALRTDLYEKGGRLRKVMKAPPERIVKKGDHWVPTLVLMKDVVDDTYTELIVDEVELDLEIPRKMFSERELQKGGR